MWDFYSILVNTEELWEYSRIPQIMLGASWRHLGHTWNPPENTYRSSGSTLAFLWAHRLALERPLGRSGKHLEQPREHWGAPGETTARLRCLEYTRDPLAGAVPAVPTGVQQVAAESRSAVGRCENRSDAFPAVPRKPPLLCGCWLRRQAKGTYTHRWLSTTQSGTI